MTPLSAPDNHFTACPHCSVTVLGHRRVGCVSGCPSIRHGIVPAAGVKKVNGIVNPPQTIISLPLHTAV